MESAVKKKFYCLFSVTMTDVMTACPAFIQGQSVVVEPTVIILQFLHYISVWIPEGIFPIVETCLCEV